MSSDNIKVAIRVRQLIQKELSSGLKSHWTVKNDTICCDEVDANGRKPTPYVFDRVFEDTTVTMDIYQEICKPIVESAMAGFNGTIFAYGQSSSGKTFTMSGSRVQQGIISLAVEEIFNTIANVPDQEFLIRVGYLEIYNEKVSDLLTNDENATIKLQEDTDRNIQVVGLTEEVVKNVENVTKCLRQGDGKRHTAETKQNDRSSRSHSILRIVIESRMVGHEDDAVKVSNLYFVDLAGSEKAGENSGDRFREGCAINRSLFTLGMVIRKLSGDVSQQHASFRDSKLTRILQNALGGNSKTAIISTITPAHVEESDSTLKFASRAKNIQTNATVNEVMNDAAMMKRYRLTIKKLESKIKEMGDSNVGETNATQSELEKSEYEKQIAEKAELIDKLKNMIVTSGSGNCDEPATKKRRRETWCPGKAKRELGSTSVPEFSPPNLNIFKRPHSYVSKAPNNQPILEEETLDDFSVYEPDMSQISPNFANDTIQTNPAIKELFDMQDKCEILTEELAKKKQELEELQEFTQLEREAEQDMIKDGKEKSKAMEANIMWLEEELMKAQQDRNNYRQKCDAMTRQLDAVEDGSGMTEKSRKLSESETKVDNLNSDLGIQKARYEFHIEQMRKKVESYTEMLVEKGVDSDYIKHRLAEDGVQNEKDISELNLSHEQELNDLRNEIDLLVIEVEKNKNKNEEICDQYDAEFEVMKERFQKDVNEAKEEIEIYRQLFEEEKAKNDAHSLNEDEKIENVSEDALKDEYEADLEELREEVTKLKLVVDNYKSELESLNEEVTKYKQLSERDNENDSSALITLSRNVERRTKNNTCIDSNGSDMELNSTISVETVVEGLVKDVCQQDNLKKHVNFDLASEIENQKQKYERSLREITEERDAYQSVLEETSQSGTNSMSKEVEDMKEKHSQEIEALKAELNRYTKIYDEVSKTNKESQVDQHTENIGVEQPETIMESQNEDLQIELNNLKIKYEEYISELESKDTEIELLKTEIKKVNSKEGSEVAELQHGDLQSELLVSELDDLKTKHGQYMAELEQKDLQIELMNSEILNLNSKKEEHVQMPNDDLQTELLRSELTELKLKYEENVVELENKTLKIELLQTEIENENGKQGELENLQTDDLQSELLRAELINLKTRHEEDIVDLEGKDYEIELLKVEIQNLKSKQERNTLEVGNGDLQSELIRAELSEIKSKNEGDVAELENKDLQIELLKTEIETLTSKQEGESNNIGNDDLQTELLRAEMNDLKLKYEEDVAELENKDLQIELLREEIDSLIEKEKETKELIGKEEEKHNRESEEPSAKTGDSSSCNDLSDKMKDLAENHAKEIEQMKEEFKIFVEENFQNTNQVSEWEDLKLKYENEIETLNSTLKSLEIEKTKTRLTDEPVTDQDGDLRNEMLQADIEALKTKHQNELDELNIELNMLKEVLEAIKAENNTERINSQAEKDKLENAHKQELEVLTLELETYKEFGDKDTVPPLQHNVENTDLHTEMLKAELDSLKQNHEDEIEGMRKQLTEYEEQLNNKESKSPFHQQESDTTMPAIDRLRDELTEEKIRNAELQSTIETDQKTYNKQLEMYESTISEMEEELKTMKGKLQVLCTDIQTLQEYNTTLKHDKLDLLNANEQTEQEKCELESSVQELHDAIKLSEEESVLLNSRISDLEAHIEMGKGILIDRNDQIETLKSTLDEQEANLEKHVGEKLTAITENCTELEGIIATKEEEIRQVNEKVAEMEALETQFSDKLICLESDIENYKDKETAMEKMCNEYEEKIVTLETDLDSVNVKNKEQEDLLQDLEKCVTGLKLDLEIAQNNDTELQDVQQTYQEKISKLESEIKDLKHQRDNIEIAKLKLSERVEGLETEFETSRTELIKKVEELETELVLASEKSKELADMNNVIEAKWKGQVNEANSETETLKTKIVEMDEKLEVYSETVKELQDEIKQSDKDLGSMRALIAEQEEEIKKNKEIVSENTFFKERIEVLESDSKLSFELIGEYETEVRGLKENLATLESAKKNTEDTKAENVARLESMEREMQGLAKEKEILVKAKEELETTVVSLEENIIQLESGLHPTALKYHSKPENVEWERKWEEFTREEKKKRMVLCSRIRGYKVSLANEEKRRENAVEEALDKLKKQERNTEQYQELKKMWHEANEDAEKLNGELREEKERAEQLSQKLATLEKAGNNKRGECSTEEDHGCKYRLELFSATRQLTEAKEEHITRISQYEETIQQYNARIGRMKNEMRRQQTMDTTFDHKGKQPQFSEELKPNTTPSVNPSIYQSAGGSTSGGIVDHFKVCITEAENKRLKKQLDENKQKIGRLEKLEKENLSLKDQLKTVQETKPSKDDVSLTPSTISRHPLGEMVKKAAEAPAAESPVSFNLMEAATSAARAEPRFKIPDLNPTKTRDVVMEQTKEELNNCKTT